MEKKLVESKRYTTKLEQKLLNFTKHRPLPSEIKENSSPNKTNQNKESMFSYNLSQRSNDKKIKHFGDDHDPNVLLDEKAAHENTNQHRELRKEVERLTHQNSLITNEVN